MVAERAVALVAARGPLHVVEIAGEVHPLLGHGWSRAGKPIATGDVEDELRSLSHQLQALDLITATRSVWSRDHPHARCCSGPTCSPTSSEEMLSGGTRPRPRPQSSSAPHRRQTRAPSVEGPAPDGALGEGMPA